jgi:four helix bundle protein
VTMEAPRIAPHEDLKILNDCVILFFRIKKITEDNNQYQYSINQHILKTALSIGSNIAEGNSLRGNYFYKHLLIAIGSLGELEFQLKVYNIDINEKEIVIDLMNKIKATCLKLQRSCGVRRGT